MRTIGDAKKLFHELVHGDKLYYIDPMKPHEVSEVTVKEVRKAVDARYVVIVYFKSDEATKLITDMTQLNPKLEVEGRVIKVDEIEKEIKDFNANLIDNIPVGKIIVDKNGTWCMTHTLPPSVYFTNKKALLKFMGK